MSFDIRFLTATPWGPSPGMLLRIFQQLLPGDDVTFEENDGSHLPMVKPVREMQRRVESLDTAASKYRSKSAEITSALQGDLALCDDPEAKQLTENLMRVHHMLADYMEGLHPILEDQKETVKQLSEYLTPPTVELFHKKANHILRDAPLQQISMAKKNTCAICMDASADCVIKRSCCVQGGAASSSSSSAPSRTHCEKDMCKCGPTMCRDCLLTHYWTSTGKGSKSYARCVCCRAEFCLKDVFPVEYVEDEAYRQMKSEQERKGKEKEREIDARRKEDPKEEGEEENRGSGRGRKSRKANNTTTTTTTTTTTSSLSLSPSTSPSTSPRAYHHSPRVTRSSSSSSLSSSSSTSPSELDEANEGPTRKRRRTNSNSNNHSTNNNSSYYSSNSYNNNNYSNSYNSNNNPINFPSTTSTTSTNTTSFTNSPNSTNFTSSTNSYNSSNNNNSNSDGEGRKYHLRSSRKNSTEK